MSQSLLLDWYISDPDPATGSSGVYAVLHGVKDDGNALHAGDLNMQPFTKVAQGDFALVMPVHTERTGYYRRTIPAGSLSLPAVGYGEEYIYEVWENASGAINRDTDVFRGSRRIKWDGTRMVDAMLGKSQELHVAYGGASYAAGTTTLQATAWLEKSGRIVTNPASCTFTIINRAGATIFSETNSTPDSNGHFYLSDNSVTLVADNSIKFTVEITDADGDTHKSGGTLSIWD